MRIKKKHVLKESLILEGLLIDDLNTISPLERKALKALHKRFKDVSMWDINTYDLIDELHDTWLLPLEIAYKIVQTYVYKRDSLFKEHDFTAKVTQKDIFKKYGSNFIKKYANSLDDEHILPEGNFWDLKFGNVILPFEPHFWSRWSNGYTIYLPLDWGLRRTTKWDNYITLINVDFDWEQNTFKMTYRIGKENEKRGVIVNNHPFDYPEGEITYNVGVDWVENNLNNIVKPLILNFTFPSVEDDLDGV